MSINRFNFRAYILKEKYMVDVEILHPEYILAYDEKAYSLNNINNSKNYILMQSTGLVDKNGKEIFEGDILEHPFIGKFFIKYSNISKRFTLIINDIKEGYEDCCGDFTWDDFVGMENKSLILGNIYENPELLKS